MASNNPFDLLGEDDNADPSAFLSKIAASAAAAKDKDKHQPKKQQPKFPTKPVPPAQAVREAKEGGRGRGGNYGRGGRGGRGSEYGRGRGGNYSEEGNFSNDGPYESNAAYRPSRQEDGDTVSGDRGRGRGRGRGGRGYGGRGGFGGESEENRRRPFDRHSSSGRSGEMKREGAGRGNWGTPSDEVTLPEGDEVAAEEEKIPTEAKPENEGTKEFSEEKKEEEEDKEMTLDEYEKLQEEKRKGLMASRAEERKVDPKEFESLKPLNKKKSEDELFMKVGSEKDKQKKADVEKVKKAMNITEFLKPSDGGGYSRGGRGRGRGRGDRGGFRGGYAGGGNAYQPEAPSIEDTSQFPTLGGK